MNIVIRTDTFLNFLQKCKLQGLVKDLVIWVSENTMFAKFSDQNKLIYCEVYEPAIKVNQEGMIKIAVLDKLYSVISRASSEVVMIVANEKLFVVSDGESAGKFRVEFVQAASVDFVESYQQIKNSDKLEFNKESLNFCGMKFEDGYEIPFETLLNISKDAKAFGFEIYKFKEETKNGKVLLSCTIEDKSLGEKFIRRMMVEKKYGTGEIKPVVVGFGLKEMITSLDKEVKIEAKGEEKKIKKASYSVYFNGHGVLITDNQKVYYTIKSIME